jgi:hypothetical protein
VARRAHQHRIIVEGRITVDPSRVSSAWVAQAYAHLVPSTCRLASGASHPSLMGDRREREAPAHRVGGRPAA